MALDRDLIVRTAIRLLDDVGLDALSLRRLAKELDVHPSALYWHFENKQELLDEMARSLVYDVVTADDQRPPQDDTWDAWLAGLAHAQRQAVRSHRDGALLLVAARTDADYQLAYLDVLVSRLVEAGFSAEQAGTAIETITNYTLGTSLIEQRSAAASRPDAAQPNHPHLTAILRAAEDHDATFERGLRWLLDGIRHTVPTTATDGP